MCLWVLTCPRCVSSLEPQGNGLNSALKGVSLCLEREGAKWEGAEHSGSWNLAPPSGLPPPGLPSGRSGSALASVHRNGVFRTTHGGCGWGGAPWRKVKGASLTILLGNHRSPGEGRREFKDAGCFPEPGEEPS